MSSATLLRLRRPAVWLTRSRWPSYSKGVSIASRVVPGSSVTTSRSWPSKRLTRLDFPTLGRPTTATWITSTSPPGPPSLSASRGTVVRTATTWSSRSRSEEHTSELQSLAYLVCRLLLEKKKKIETELDHVMHRRCPVHYSVTTVLCLC